MFLLYHSSSQRWHGKCRTKMYLLPRRLQIHFVINHTAVGTQWVVCISGKSSKPSATKSIYPFMNTVIINQGFNYWALNWFHFMMISDLPRVAVWNRPTSAIRTQFCTAISLSSRLLIYAAQPAQSHGEPVLTCTCQGSGAHTQTMTWGLLR